MIEKLTAEAINPALKLRYGRAKSAADLERTAVALEGNGFVVGRAANAAEGVNKILVINREVNPRPHHRGPGRRGHRVLRQALPLKEE